MFLGGYFLFCPTCLEEEGPSQEAALPSAVAAEDKQFKHPSLSLRETLAVRHGARNYQVFMENSGVV